MKKMSSDFYSEKFSRNPFTTMQQNRIRRSVFAIVGLGGTGGFILENLLRAGAQNFILFENDRFELSNFNRQMLATEEFLDMPKAYSAIARARSINPDAEIRSFGRFDSSSSANLNSASVVVDATDNVATKLGIAEASRKLKIPYVFCSASGTRGIVSVFKNYSFGKAFHLPTYEYTMKVGRGKKATSRDSRMSRHDILKDYKTCSTILCAAASLSASFAASQAINIIIGKPFVKAPEALFFDLNQKSVFWTAKLG